MEYKSREIVCALVDDMVSDIVGRRESDDDSDVDYGRRVAWAVASSLDADGLSTLADFLPSIRSLIPLVAWKETAGCTHRQLVLWCVLGQGHAEREGGVVVSEEFRPAAQAGAAING